ncbi:MAG: cytochrome c oxidase subunit II [Dehalococcoidia bacterium]
MFLIRRLPLSPAQLLILLAAVVAVLAGCTPDNPQSTFDARGPVAQQQLDLFLIVFWIAVGIFIVVEGAIIFMALRFRQRGQGLMPKQIHGHTKLEVTWTIIPALILVGVAVPTVQGIYDTYAPSSEMGTPIEIESVGHQWWFEFRYPDEEIVTANEVHIPTGVPVMVKLYSQDVIHSFWVPKLAGKVDMVPANDNQVWFQADEAGVYYGQCAEFCGLQHALMRFRVIAHEPEEYDAWVQGMRTPPDPPEPGSGAARGQGLFAGNCSMCHTTDSFRQGGYAAELEVQEARWEAWWEAPEESRVVSAPNLTHFGERTTIGAGVADLTRESLIGWITSPDSLKSGTRMATHALVYDTPNHHADLAPQDIQDIADYLLSLTPGSGAVTPPPGGGDPVEQGEALFAQRCSTCHSTGPDDMTGPGLQGVVQRADTRKPDLSAEQYIEESLRQPGEYVVDGFLNVMPSFAGLSDEEVSNLIAYLNTLE